MSESTLTLIPHLCCRGAAEAYAFYQKAFGAEPVAIYEGPGGGVMHASLNLRGALIYLVDENPAHGALSPLSTGGSPVTLQLQVPDCDAVFQRAVDAGCTVRMPLEDMFWGDRWGLLVDPYGHSWAVATTIRQVSPDELRQATASMTGADCPAPAAA